MDPIRARKTLQQLLMVRDRKIQSARLALKNEQAQLVKQQILLVTKQKAYEEAERNAKQQEQAWFAEAQATPLKSSQLEQLLARISILRDQVAEKAQDIVRQQRVIDEQTVALNTALKKLQSAQKDYEKLELMQGKIQHTLVQLEQRKEDSQAEDMPQKIQRVFA